MIKVILTNLVVARTIVRVARNTLEEPFVCDIGSGTEYSADVTPLGI